MADLARPECQSDLSSRVTDERPDYLRHFPREPAIRSLNEFLGFVLEEEATGSSTSSDTVGSILTLARLDAFTATVVSCLLDDGMDSVNSQKLKLYHEKFSCFLRLALHHLPGSIRMFIQDWCPGDLTVSCLPLLKSAASSGGTFQREATVEIYIPSLDKRIVPGTWKLFSEKIFDELGAVHDYCIAEYGSIKDGMQPLGTKMVQVRSPPDCSLSTFSEKLYLF